MHKLNVEQGSPEWFDARFGKVTGTRLQSAVGAKWDARKSCWKYGDVKVQNTLMYELVAERTSANEIDDSKSKAMERGNELEPFAVKSASDERELEFITCGMLVSDDVENFAISPDAIHEKDGIVIGGLETKCPNGKKHIEYIINDELPREYFFQVIAPFVMSDDVQWWDFASYDDRNYNRELFIIRVEREDVAEDVEQCRKHLAEFLERTDEAHMGIVF